MSIHLQQLREWIEKRYEELGLEVNFERPQGPRIELRAPKIIWRSINNAAADLLDSQIGVWIRFSAVDAGEDVNGRISSDVRWALEAASKLDHRSGVAIDNSDPLGGWQVHLVWIVDEASKSGWDASIRNLRNSSAHAEEIGIDVLEQKDGSLRQALERDGVPSLLFQTRRLLAKTVDAVPPWLSPDKEFLTLVAQLPSQVADLEQREFAENFIRGLASEESAEIEQSSPISFSGPLIIENFRNIVNAELRLDEIDAALVVHGPNGSGKSSLFEAICLALFGTSQRHVKYLADNDVSTALRKTYVQNVLTRFDPSQSEFARISIGGRDVLTNLELDHIKASEQMLAAHGTVLPQESSAEFVSMDAAKLAARVLGDYSPRSRDVQNEVARGVQSAKEEWQSWLRSIGLSVTITKPETILRRVVTGALLKFVPANTSATLDWIQDLSHQYGSFSDSVATARARWLDLDSIEARDALSLRIAKKVETSGSGEDAISAWLRERVNVSEKIVDVLNLAEQTIAPLREEWLNLKEEILSWSQWIHRQSHDEISDKGDDESDANKIEELSRSMASLQPAGTILRERRDHIQAAMNGVLRNWSNVKPHTCPTCDQDHVGLIRDIVSDNFQRVEAEYDRVRSEYAELQEQLKGLRKAQVVTVTSPVSDARAAELSSLLGYPASGPDALENRIRSEPNFTSGFVNRFDRLLVKQAWQADTDLQNIELLARDVAAHIGTLRREGFAKQELPAKWEALAAAINQISLKVVRDHLPNTIESVWREISLALAPARWNQVRVPDMAMNIQNKGQEQLQVVIRRSESSPSVPARHILNQAEQNLLGLSWFLTRYLTHGRFLAPLLVMDDPAQDMDQVTFRRFARFLQAFVRLHKAVGRALNVVITLHQEERALDIARAISPSGELTVLDWAQQVRFKGPTATVRRVMLRNPEQRAPIPEPISYWSAETNQSIAAS